MLHRVFDYHLSTLYFRALQKHIQYDVGAVGILVVQYTMKHQKYVPACSCTVKDEASDICDGI
jgi:hypothetical protein